MLTGAGTHTRTQKGTYNNPKEEIEKPLCTCPLPCFFPVYTNLSHCGSSLAGPVRWQPSLVGGVIVLPTRWADRQCSKGKELIGPRDVRAGPFCRLFSPCWSMLPCSGMVHAAVWLSCALLSVLNYLLLSSWAPLPLGHSIRNLSDEQINSHVLLLAPKQSTKCDSRGT